MAATKTETGEEHSCSRDVTESGADGWRLAHLVRHDDAVWSKPAVPGNTNVIRCTLQGFWESKKASVIPIETDRCDEGATTCDGRMTIFLMTIAPIDKMQLTHLASSTVSSMLS